MSFILTTLNVSDMNESLAFYRDLLHLPLVGQLGKDGDAFRISFLGEEQGTHLELIQGNGAPQPSESISIGFLPDNLQEILEKCADTAVGPISPNPQTTFWFVRDPDGYRVQLMQG